MTQLTIYASNDALAPHFECQIRAYVRFLWHDHYLYDVDAPLVPPERHPQFVVLAEKHALLSAARITWVIVYHAGQHFKMYCLGDVFTYPAFRKRGYGQQVVEVATSLILGDREADTAILYTDPSLERFYTQCGWEHIPGLSAMIGAKSEPEAYNGFAMMLFISDKAKEFRASFETQTVFLPGYGW